MSAARGGIVARSAALGKVRKKIAFSCEDAGALRAR
jgi:hypothetical protein